MPHNYYQKELETMPAEQIRALQEELGEIFLQFEERLEPQEVHYTTAPINAICFTLNNAGKPIYQLGINGQDAASCQLMRAIADKTKPSEGMS